MRISRVGILLLILTTVLIGTNCNYYGKVMSRRDLVDGAEAYKKKEYDRAEELFRDAISRDPEGKSLEGKTAQLFLARTLHSRYISDRTKQDKALAAIEEYKKVLAKDINEQSSFNAVANLYETMKMENEWNQWVTERANNEQVEPASRAEAYVKLAARQYTCANNISDVEPVKKTILEDGKPVFNFTKPEDPAEFEKLKQCADKGYELADKATQLNPESDSAWSYKANLLQQKSRIAEMEEMSEEEIEKIKTQAEQARDKFSELAEAKRKKEEAEEAERKAKEEAEKKK